MRTQLLLSILLFLPTLSHAAIKDSDAIKAIIGEAAGEDNKGKLAVACTLRARNTLKGVNGLTNDLVKHHRYNQATALRARIAWENSGDIKNCSFIDGAHGWGNNRDILEFRKHKWWNNCHITYIHGNHYFYKCEEGK